MSELMRSVKEMKECLKKFVKKEIFLSKQMNSYKLHLQEEVEEDKR